MRKEQEGIVEAFFKSQDAKFVEACMKAGIKPTKRQASKWLNHKGLAFKEVNK